MDSYGNSLHANVKAETAVKLGELQRYRGGASDRVSVDLSK
jgi:hypothetical protein